MRDERPGWRRWRVLCAALVLGALAAASPARAGRAGDRTLQPFGIARGPDNNLWFAETNASTIGRITPLGRITEFPV